jgi:5'-nucleotidase
MVVAPYNPRSAVSNSITLHKPIRVRKLGAGRFGIEGTPTDCVKLALEVLCKRAPDLVVSGINDGANVGCDILYSGTVAGAFEAALQGVPAVAVSLKRSKRMDYIGAAQTAMPIIRRLTGRPGIVFNVNIPRGPKSRFKGIKITRQAGMVFRDRFQKRTDPNGREYYWLHGSHKPFKGGVRSRDRRMTDDRAVRQGYVSVTPLSRDLTSQGDLEGLERRLGV